MRAAASNHELVGVHSEGRLALRLDPKKHLSSLQSHLIERLASLA